MRWLILLGLAACGSDAGTILTVAAPGGPASAKRIEIVLGRAADDAITAVDRQRMRPGDLAVEPVRYYRQRATAGAVEGVKAVDGFAVRIQQDDGVADDDSFIPFLLAYDANGGLVGAGAVLDDQGAPSSIAIETGQLTSYVVTMTPLVAADPKAGLAAGQAIDVACVTNSTTWRSGVAWQPGGTQLRLLLPDTSENAKATDATARPANLDCDKHEADKDDCDDLQARYHPGGAPDTCDGEDTNCAGDRLIATDCPPEAAACAPTTTGIQLCSDTGTGTRFGTCTPDPACQCATVNPACTRCIIQYKNVAGTTREPCAPAVGQLHLACTLQMPCTVEVLPQGAWDAKLATAPNGPFGTRVTAGSDNLFLRVKYLANTVDAPAPSSVGAVYLAVTSGGAPPRYVGVDLEILPGGVADCSQVPTSNGNFSMTCPP